MCEKEKLLRFEGSPIILNGKKSTNLVTEYLKVSSQAKLYDFKPVLSAQIVRKAWLWLSATSEFLRVYKPTIRSAHMVRKASIWLSGISEFLRVCMLNKIYKILSHSSQLKWYVEHEFGYRLLVEAN